MSHYPTFLRHRACALRDDNRGVAMIEFAFSLPVLLVLCMAGLETANLALAHMRLSQIATLVADNASRVRTSIDEADINEIMVGAELTSDKLDLQQHGRVILSSLEHNGQTAANEGQTIRWQRCWGNGVFPSSYGNPGDGATDASMRDGMGPGTTAATKITSGTGTAVMFVEVAYTYQPLVTDALFGPKIIRYTSAFNVRERTDQAIKNAGHLAASATARCS